MFTSPIHSQKQNHEQRCELAKVWHGFLSCRIRANGANAGRFPGCVRSGCASPSTRSLFGGGSLVEFDELALGAQLVPGVRLYAVLPDLAGADMD